MWRPRGRNGAQTIEPASCANADAIGERIKVSEHVDQQTEALKRIARVEEFTQARAEDGADL